MAHTGVADMLNGKPTILVSGGSPATMTEKQLVDKWIASSRVKAGNYAIASRQSAARIRHTMTVAESGNCALYCAADVICKVRGCDRTTDGMARDTHHTIFAKQHTDPAKAARIGRHCVVDRVEHADHGSRP